MPTAQDYAKWIVANQDKAGSQEFVTVAEAYKKALAEEESARPDAEKAMAREFGAQHAYRR
jgi:hypothetical protein